MNQESKQERKADTVVAFLDTNYCIHFKQPSEIDWQSRLNAKTVRLVVVAGVIAEIDKHKYEPKLSERATAWGDLLEKCLDTPVQVRKNVTLEIYSGGGDDVGDRSIAAQAKHFIVTTGITDAVFVTNDTLAAVALHAQGIMRVKPSLDDRLPLPKTVEQTKIIKLESELKDAVSKQPKLDVFISGPDLTGAGVQPLRYTVTPTKPYMVREILPKIHTDLFNAGISPQSVNPWEARYVENWKTWCENEDVILDESARTICIWIKCKNTSTVPIQRANITISYDPTIFCSADIEGYTVGDRAKHETQPFHKNGHQYVKSTPVVATPPGIYGVNRSPPYGCSLNSGQFTTTIENLSHEMERQWNYLYLTFASWEKVGPFKFDCKIYYQHPSKKSETFSVEGSTSVSV